MGLCAVPLLNSGAKTVCDLFFEQMFLRTFTLGFGNLVLPHMDTQHHNSKITIKNEPVKLKKKNSECSFQISFHNTRVLEKFMSCVWLVWESHVSSHSLVKAGWKMNEYGGSTASYSGRHWFCFITAWVVNLPPESTATPESIMGATTKGFCVCVCEREMNRFCVGVHKGVLNHWSTNVLSLGHHGF